MDRLSRLVRYTPWIGVAALALVIAVPHIAQAVTGTLSPGFSIIPQVCRCPEGAGWGCVLMVVQNLFQFVIFVGVLLCVVGVVWGGFELVLSPINPGNKEKGRTMLINAAIGLLIVLGAYLMVNTLLTVLTGKTLNQTTSVFGSASGNCLPTAVDKTGTSQGTTSGLGGAGVGTAPPLQNGSGACSSLTVQNGARDAGYSLSSAQAQTLACIANAESSCGASNLNYNYNNGSSAAGAFQVLLQTHSDCYDNNVCEAAVGQNTPLNCKAGFSGGNPIPNSPIADKCERAAANVSCSSAAAACVLQKQGFSAWTSDPRNAKQKTCINTYGA